MLSVPRGPGYRIHLSSEESTRAAKIGPHALRKRCSIWRNQDWLDHGRVVEDLPLGRIRRAMLSSLNSRGTLSNLYLSGLTVIVSSNPSTCILYTLPSFQIVTEGANLYR